MEEDEREVKTERNSSVVPAQTVVSTATVDPARTVGSTATVDPARTVGSTATVDPARTVGSTATVDPARTVGSTATVDPVRTVGSTATVDPARTVGSTATVDPARTLGSTATVDPARTVGSTATVDPARTVGSTATVDPVRTVGSTATVDPARTVGSTTTVDLARTVGPTATVDPFLSVDPTLLTNMRKRLLKLAPGVEQRKRQNVMPNSKEQRKKRNVVPNSREEKKKQSIVPNSKEERINQNGVLNSKEQKKEQNLVPNLKEERIKESVVPNSKEQRKQQSIVPNLKEQRKKNGELNSSNSVPEVSLKFLYSLDHREKAETIQWCQRFGFIAERYECPRCGGNMNLVGGSRSIDGVIWRCRKKGMNSHDVVRSVRCGTWFSQSHLSIPDILRLAKFWFIRTICQVAEIELGIAKQTVTDWYTFFREIATLDIIEKSSKLGGPGVTVEIDESKFRQMSYNKGRRVDGEWVFLGIERGRDKVLEGESNKVLERGSDKVLVRVVPTRGKDVLLPILREWILPGSIVMSYCWKTYDCLNDEGFMLLSAANSLTLVDPPETPGHKTTVESIWSKIKRFLRNTNHVHQGDFDSYLGEYLWRKSHGNSYSHATFLKFLDAVKNVYPPPERD